VSASEQVPLRDFLEDAFEAIEWNELRTVVPELEAKSRRVQALLQPVARLDALTRAELETLSASIFVARRHREQVLDARDDHAFKRATRALLYEQGEVATRINRFLADLQVINESLGAELAGELLHFTFPDRYWLFSRWMYNRASGTGILPVLLDGDQELRAETAGATYVRIGRAIMVVTQVEDTKWLWHGGLSDSPRQHPFAIDTFLAAAYCAYVYGVTAWRLTREFHKVLPPLPRLVRRMLGLKTARAWPSSRR